MGDKTYLIVLGAVGLFLIVLVVIRSFFDDEPPDGEGPLPPEGTSRGAPVGPP